MDANLTDYEGPYPMEDFQADYCECPPPAAYELYACLTAMCALPEQPRAHTHTHTHTHKHTSKPTRTNAHSHTRTDGFVRDLSTCPPNYPEGAPKNLCSHISLVEIDAPMSYRHAMAYVTTGNEAHADKAMGIVQAWATINKQFGPKDRNGPLEAAWCVGGRAGGWGAVRRCGQRKEGGAGSSPGNGRTQAAAALGLF